MTLSTTGKINSADRRRIRQPTGASVTAGLLAGRMNDNNGGDGDSGDSGSDDGPTTGSSEGGSRGDDIVIGGLQLYVRTTQEFVRGLTFRPDEANSNGGVFDRQLVFGDSDIQFDNREHQQTVVRWN